MHPEDPSEDLRLQFISAVPQCWADRGHYSYLDSPRPEDALLFFLPEESGCSFTLYLDSGALFHPKQGDIFYTPRGSTGNIRCDEKALAPSQCSSQRGLFSVADSGTSAESAAVSRFTGCASE